MVEPASEDDFWNFVVARHEIFHRRFELQQPPPWTSESLLESHKYCNVYRELDRTSLWYITHVARPDLPLLPEDKPRLVYSTIAYRFWNNPTTYGCLTTDDGGNAPSGRLFVPEQQAALRRYIRQAPKPHIARAYTVSSHRKGVETDEYIIKYILKPLVSKRGRVLRLRIANASSAKEAFDLLYSIHGLGGTGFLSYQILLDLNMSPLFSFDVENTFVVPGPGTKRGLERIFGELRSEVDLLVELCACSTRELQKRSFLFFRNRKLSLESVSNCCCEYDKYRRKLEYDSGASSHRAVLRKFRGGDDSSYLEMLNSQALTSLYERWRRISPIGFLS